MNSKNGFWRITFDTNPNDCNLHCIMCEHHSLYSNVEKNRILSGIPKARMPIELIGRVLETTKDSPLQEVIPSTMGEPLLYKDFAQIVELCKKFKVKLNLTTNSTFPVKDVDYWAELVVPVASDVKISWNGATKEIQEKIMQGSNFEQGIQNIRDFVKIRDEHARLKGNYCQITLQLTFMETNLHELEDIIRFAINLGIDRIKGHHVWINFPELAPLSLRKNAESIAKWNKIVTTIKEIAKNNFLPNGKQINLVNFDLLEDDADSNLTPGGICQFLGNEAWIATDGHFSPCCTPDERRKKLGNFGSVYERDLLDIWHDKDYQYLVKNYMQHEVCVTCLLRCKPNSKLCKV